MASEVQFDKLFEEQEKEKQVNRYVQPATYNNKIGEDDSIFIDDSKDREKTEVDMAKEKLGLGAKEIKEEPNEEPVIENAQNKLFAKEKEEEWQARSMKSGINRFVYEDDGKKEHIDPAKQKDREYLNSLYGGQNDNENPIINAEDYDDYKEKMREFNERKNKVERDESYSGEKPSAPSYNFDIEPQKENVNANKYKIAESIDGLNDNPSYNSNNQNSSFVSRNNALFDDIENKSNASNNDEDDDSEDLLDPLDNDLEENAIVEDAAEDYIKPSTFGNEEKKPTYDKRSDYVSDEKSSDLSSSINNTFNLNSNPRNFNFEVINGPTDQDKKDPDFTYNDEYVRPPVSLLHTYESKNNNPEDVTNNIEILENTLNEFGIPAKVEGVCRGAAVTRYELRMPSGIPVRKVEAHASDIELALAARSSIRIEAPIKGKSAVGIEVPNASVDIVGLKDIVSSTDFVTSKKPLNFALGKDIDGSVRCCDLAKMPHLLVAGSTNSGKSVCLNALLISLIYHTSPRDLRIMLVDPKQVEFTIFNNLPHMLLPKAIVDPKKVMNAFDWLINEMERRYTLFRDNYVRKLDEYNNLSDVISGKKPKLPNIVLIVDELADLVVTLNRKELDERIIRLTQKARAAGIHLILATQRPSVDIITGVIKVNLPSRIAFAVTSAVDSKTILGTGGAENLLGRGDMIYSPTDGEPVRVQGAFVDTDEVRDVVEFVKQNNKSNYDPNIAKEINGESAPQGGGSYNATPAVDSLMPDALKLVIENGQASSSMLQRRFAIGFQRASKIIDQMQQAGFISSNEGAKPRVVYITMEDYNKLYGGGN